MKKLRPCCFLFSMLMFTSVALSDIKLPAIFSDHMVLQQNSPVTIWGWAEPGEKVTVKGSWRWFFGKSVRANKNGKWSVVLNTPKTGKTVTLTFKGKNNEIMLNDILLGEVWICSGQSNMAISMGRLDTERAKTDVDKADFPEIRLFAVKKTISITPNTDLEGNWQVSSPETVEPFSATGYYFWKTLYENLKIPIGLISTNWGGTPIEAWTSQQTLREFEEFADKLAVLSGFNRDNSEVDKNNPTVLYNGMIAPLIPFRIAGAIWYQGEGNKDKPILYRSLFPAMINDWRILWNQGDFPFYYVQIAPFQYLPKFQSQALREAQMITLNSLPNLGMAVTMDIGEEKNIHPRNKQDVGDRLARWALAKTYGREDIVYSGPIYKSMTVKNNKVIIAFDYVDGGLLAKDGGLIDFEIAGTDQIFVSAKAIIDGNTVVVSSADVTEPVAVRYCWSNWAKGSLFNKAGLPASSFRTDDWPLKVPTSAGFIVGRSARQW